MQFTMEEILDMVGETIGTCFFLALFWQFVASGSPYSLAAVVERLSLSLGG